MPEIIVISGKGGTGKTSLTAAFAHLAKKPIMCDLDVDAPDLHLLLQPQIRIREDFYSGNEAVIDEALCTGCGICRDMCRFDAVVQTRETFSINPLKCEGCKVCVAFCPAGAIGFPRRHCGRWYVSDTRFGPMVHAQLFPGAENSGKLVALLRQKATAMAADTANALVICDGAPGIGCPVISSLSGIHFAVLVTEPTPSGRHDLARVAELCTHFKVPVGVIINKADLNEQNAQAIEHWCRTQNAAFLGRLPYDPAVTEAMVRRQTVTEYAPNGLAVAIGRIWERVLDIAQTIENKRPAA